MYEIEYHIGNFEDTLLAIGSYDSMLRLKWCRAAFLQGSSVEPIDQLSVMIETYYKS
jgi:hypothetical protein